MGVGGGAGEELGAKKHLFTGVENLDLLTSFLKKMKESSLETTKIKILFKRFFFFYQTAWRHMATWTHMVTRTHMGENTETLRKHNIIMNIALKLSVSAWHHAFLFNKRMHF